MCPFPLTWRVFYVLLYMTDSASHLFHSIIFGLFFKVFCKWVLTLSACQLLCMLHLFFSWLLITTIYLFSYLMHCFLFLFMSCVLTTKDYNKIDTVPSFLISDLRVDEMVENSDVSGLKLRGDKKNIM